MSASRWLCAFFLFLANGLAWAQEPKLRAAIETKGDVWVGQRITLSVELLVPGFFSGVPAFDLPDRQGLLLLPPVGSPIIASEEIAGVAYTVQRHELSIFARTAGRQEIPPIPVRLEFKRHPLDKETVPAALKTEPLTITIKTPPGAEKLGSVISAHDLKAVEQWQPEPGRAKAGDAFTRTITFSADDVPGMAFPPFQPGRIDGLGIYPKPPIVNDHRDRGTLSGERTESITYLCQRPGRFVIPAARLTWWGLDDQQLHVIDFPQRVLEVAVNPAQPAALPPGAPLAPSGVSWPEVLRWLGLLALAVVALEASRRLGFWRVIHRALLHFLPRHLAPLNPGENAQSSTQK